MVRAVPVFGRVTAFPAMEYYIRSNVDDPAPFGPVSLVVAQGYARRFSRMNETGLAEIYTLVGNRPGDYQTTPALKVVAVLRRGKWLLQGQVAQYVSEHKIPPSP